MNGLSEVLAIALAIFLIGGLLAIEVYAVVHAWRLSRPGWVVALVLFPGLLSFAYLWLHREPMPPSRVRL
jgi:hypothetical protein